MLYLGYFSFVRGDEESGSDGTMSAVVEAQSADEASQKLEALVKKNVEADEFTFAGVSHIFMEMLIEISGGLEEGLVAQVSFEESDEDGESMTVTSILPEVPEGVAQAYAPEEEDGTIAPFLSF